MLDPQLSQIERDDPEWVSASMRLYNRCVVFHELRLPEEGGLFEQKEIYLQILEQVHEAVVAHRAKKMNDKSIQARQEAEKAKRGKRGGIGWRRR